MPPRSIVSLLPAPVRNDLDRRLRASAYGDLEGLADWLTAEGHPISKSSLGTYSMKLKARDRGMLEEVSERDRLLLELGRIRFRELQLFDQLMAQEEAEH